MIRIIGYTGQCGGLYRCECTSCSLEYLLTPNRVDEDTNGLCPHCEAEVLVLEGWLRK